MAFTSKSAPPKIIYSSSRARPNQAEIDADFSKRWGVDVSRVDDKDEIAQRSDILIVLCSLSPSTKDTVNKDFLKKMKKTAVLVNSARVRLYPSALLTTGTHCQFGRPRMGT